MLAVVYKKTHVDVHTKEFLTNTLTEHYSVGKDRDAVAITWDQIMGNFQCCGVMDHTDFVKAKNFINTSRLNQKVIHNHEFYDKKITIFPRFQSPAASWLEISRTLTPWTRHV